MLASFRFLFFCFVNSKKLTEIDESRQVELGPPGPGELGAAVREAGELAKGALTFRLSNESKSQRFAGGIYWRVLSGVVGQEQKSKKAIGIRLADFHRQFSPERFRAFTTFHTGGPRPPSGRPQSTPSSWPRLPAGSSSGSASVHIDGLGSELGRVFKDYFRRRSSLCRREKRFLGLKSA